MMIFDDVVENDICMLCAARLIFFYLLTCSLTLDLPLLYNDFSNINSIVPLHKKMRTILSINVKIVFCG
jgi:hypothetical protein